MAPVGDRVVGIHWILSWLQNRFCAHTYTTSSFRSLASEFYPGRSTFADAATHLGIRTAGRISGALGGTIAESCSTADDFMLVHQQLVRSADRRRLDALPGRRTDSLHNASQRRHFLSLRSIRGSVFSSFLDAAFVLWNNWGKDTYSGADPDTPFFNALAALIVVPLIVAWATTGIRSLRTSRLSRYLEACALFVGLLLVSYAVLYKFGSGADSALLFLPLPFLLWAAVRFGFLGASTAISVVSFLAIWSAAHQHGPFSGGPPEQDALSIQIFLIVLAIPLLFLATVIEERRTGETVLRESESRFRIVADAAPVLIWMSGVDKLCTFFNKPWLEFTGRSVEQELGNGWAEGVHADDLQRCLKTYTEAFDARKPFVMQYRLRRRDGEYRWVSDDGVPRYDTLGEFAGYIGSCVDITELLKKEEALREFEERVTLAAQAAHLGVWEMDTTTNEIWMSDMARTLYQFDSKTRVDHAALQDRVHPEDRELRNSTVKTAVETQSEYEIEYRLLLPDGTLRWIGGRGRCVTGENRKGARLIGVSIDITPRKLAEAEARQYHEQVGHLSRVAAVGELAASIAHEVNQPLSGIISNAGAGRRLLDRGDVELRELRGPTR